jgi:hypothetical protein
MGPSVNQARYLQGLQQKCLLGYRPSVTGMGTGVRAPSLPVCMWMGQSKGLSRVQCVADVLESSYNLAHSYTLISPTPWPSLLQLAKFSMIL